MWRPTNPSRASPPCPPESPAKMGASWCPHTPRPGFLAATPLPSNQCPDHPICSSTIFTLFYLLSLQETSPTLSLRWRPCFPLYPQHLGALGWQEHPCSLLLLSNCYSATLVYKPLLWSQGHTHHTHGCHLVTLSSLAPFIEVFDTLTMIFLSTHIILGTWTLMRHCSLVTDVLPSSSLQAPTLMPQFRPWHHPELSSLEILYLRNLLLTIIYYHPSPSISVCHANQDPLNLCSLCISPVISTTMAPLFLQPA